MGFPGIEKSDGKMRLRTRMLLLTSSMLIGLLVIVAMTSHTLNTVRIGGESYRKIKAEREKLDKAISLRADLLRLQAEELKLSGESDSEKIRQGVSAVKSLLPEISAGFAAVDSAIAAERKKSGFPDALKAWRTISAALQEETVPAAQRGDRERLRSIPETQTKRYDRIAAVMDSLIVALRADIAAVESKEAGSVRSSIMLNIAIGIGIVLMMLLFAWKMMITMVRAVQRQSAFTRAIVTGGNLSGRLVVESSDEIGELAESLNTLVGLLHEMVAKIDASSLELTTISGILSDASKQVFRGAEQTNARVAETSSAIIEINASIKEVSHGVDSLSLSASENSSSVLEMAASVEEVALNVENLVQSVDDVSSSIIEMAAAIKHISDSVSGLIDSSTVTASSVIEMDSSIRQVEKSAIDTAAISEEVRRDAETGKVSVEATISGMQEIKRSSHITHEVIVTLSEKAKDIGTILSVINEVAEQTNLLALNAAIIAAQAGEQGKGFAVVADEIKELADRTSSSTREIEELVKGVQDETRRAVDAIDLAEKCIADGELLSQKSGIALGKIVSGVEKATVQVSEIAHAAAEQARGSQMIRDAMEQVTDMIMQIANATHQQSKGSELIMTSVERMKVLTSQVRSSTREQSKVGSLIAGSTENITSMIRQIKRACDEQSRGSEQIVSAVNDIQQSTHENLSAAGTMDKAVGGLSKQVAVLKKGISSFTLREDR
jgi:methyl-accepting chemotaxis protein